MFAFSTCWNSDAHTNGEAMMDEIRSLGFLNVELSHGIRVSLIEGIQRAMKKEPRFRITSVHNFCPLPVGYIRSAPNVYQFSSPSDSERQQAIRHTLHTMDFAVRMGARHVVLHLGRVSMESCTRELLGLIAKGKQDTPEYTKRAARALARRAARGEKPFLRAMECLEKLADEARNRNLILAVESRQRIEEIPSESEMEELLSFFSPQTVGYWHDTGHVQCWHHLGLADHVAWLRKFQGRLVGGHVHDTLFPDHDHQIPGDGQVPFQDLTALRRPDVLKVFEFEPGMPAGELQQRLPSFMKKFETAADPESP